MDEDLPKIIADEILKIVSDRMSGLELHVARLVKERGRAPYHDMAFAAMDSLVRSEKKLSPQQLAKMSYDIADAMKAEGEQRIRKERGIVAVPSPKGDLDDVEARIEQALGQRDKLIPVRPGGNGT